jgi:hydroxymethylpyrimidine pyrophosphatase-like HAD family hydrolase
MSPGALAIPEPLSAAPAETDAEAAFYGCYPWCLNPWPTVGHAAVYLGAELDRLATMRDGWQAGEVRTNVFLLSCALLNSVDDYLRGPAYRLPRRANLPPARALLWLIEKATAAVRFPRAARVRRWRQQWQERLDTFLRLFLADGPADPDALARAGTELRPLLPPPLPRRWLEEHTQIPSAFRKQDLTHFDVPALGRKLIAGFPDRQRPILVLGLRTAGSFFAPLLRAFLQGEGYEKVKALTARPSKGLARWERAELSRCARAGHLVAIVDDPPGSGDTLGQAVDLARAADFGRDRIAVLFPTHPRRRHWTDQAESITLAGLPVFTLGPEEWYKQHLLTPEAVEGRLAEYFRRQGYIAATVVPSAAAEKINARLEAGAEETRRIRLKRVYEVRLENAAGRQETRFVLAKSVGWGWLGYHAFTAGRRLAGHVPPLLGLRDGILFLEWLQPADAGTDRKRSLEDAAAYVAARTRTLALEGNPGAEATRLAKLARSKQHEGFAVLSKMLSRAYGGMAAAGLMRARVQHRLADLPCSRPTWIDGRMRPAEWIAGPAGLLKTDFEHHGLGKNELNVVDPAYDLAETIFQWKLTPEEEARLLCRYAELSGDPTVAERLFPYKLLAGAWALHGALRGLLYQPQLSHRHGDFHQQYMAAWHFLTVAAARFCGDLCRPAHLPRWGGPLVVLDVDGVLDLRHFGFPCTSAAGIQALALLHEYGRPIALDTARSAEEVREYCRAYGLVGGVAEYGAYIWDAVAGRGRCLLGDEALGQLEQARQALGRLPGVFLDERYRYSVRACTYEENGPVPLPTLTMQQVMAAEGLNKLRFMQTTIDTTLVAREADKGTGLAALLDWVGQPRSEVVAIGDTEPDLEMFRVAGQSFAPGHIRCSRLARSLGCRIARQPHQRGLLEIVRQLGNREQRTASSRADSSCSLFMDLLEAQDRSRWANLLRAVLDPLAWRVFVR